MKKQKIRGLIIQKQMETVFGSTERSDAIDHIQDVFNLSSGQLKAIISPGSFGSDYWNR